jgi:hypothetical protein
MLKISNTTLEIFNAFEDLITRMDSDNKEIILLGDYNCDWSRLDSNSANAQTNKLAGIAQIFQFQQLVSDPTRITANSKTLIDLAFTNKPELINGSGVIHLGISDHSLIYRMSKKTLWKFNRLSCIINVAKQLNFYIRRKNSYLA